MRRDTVGDCGAEFVVELPASDLDGGIAAYGATLERGDPATVASYADGRFVLPAGGHAGGARYTVWAEDAYGARAERELTLLFEGDGCLPPRRFVGVQGDTCVGVEVDPVAGDDRGGVVRIADWTYYNGDMGLVRVNDDLTIESWPELTLDTLLGDPITDTLWTTWSSDFTAWEVDNATEAWWSEVGTIDQVAILEPATLDVDLVIDLEDELPHVHDTQIYAARDGLLIFAWEVPESSWVTWRIVDGFTGVTVWESSYSRGSGGAQPTYWNTQEDNIAHYAAGGSADDLWLTWREGDVWYTWRPLSDETLAVSSETFALGCDVNNLALTAVGDQVWFHDEGNCYLDRPIAESVVRCDVAVFEGDAPPQDTAVEW